MRGILKAGCFALFFMAICSCNDIQAPAPNNKTLTTQNLIIDLGNGVSMEMVLIPSGSFMMGSEKGEENEKPVHLVTLSKPFYIGKYPVTQAQWLAVMGDNPSEFKNPNNPVEEVSWEDCQLFIQALAKKIPGRGFDLPTEAQWEYACRAGSSTDYYFGDDAAKLDDYAWYLNNSDNKSHPVGQKKPNAWGLYDMNGNVCQWCADWYAPAYPAGDAVDPTGPASGEAAVLRGESWVGLAYELRSADRVGTPIYYRNSHVGLRLVCQADN